MADVATIIARQNARATATNTAAIDDVNERILTLLDELVTAITTLSTNLAAVVEHAVNQPPATPIDTPSGD